MCLVASLSSATPSLAQPVSAGTRKPLSKSEDWKLSILSFYNCILRHTFTAYSPRLHPAFNSIWSWRSRDVSLQLLNDKTFPNDLGNAKHLLTRSHFYLELEWWTLRRTLALMNRTTTTIQRHNTFQSMFLSVSNVSHLLVEMIRDRSTRGN
jgi:hypothetical protein